MNPYKKKTKSVKKKNILKVKTYLKSNSNSESDHFLVFTSF